MIHAGFNLAEGRARRRSEACLPMERTGPRTVEVRAPALEASLDVRVPPWADLTGMGQA
jgi:hypothetical protein